LLKRAVEQFKSCSHVVGGHVKKNESLKEAEKREFTAETGLDIGDGAITDDRI
jgi:ADP-ribose pyrophosphatase YjhB (NUDIX family)